MSDNANPPLEKYAIEEGAYIFLQKPIGMDVAKYLGQHVFSEKMRQIKDLGKFKKVANNNNTPTNDQILRGNFGKLFLTLGLVLHTLWLEMMNIWNHLWSMCNNWDNVLSSINDIIHEKLIDLIISVLYVIWSAM